MIPKELIIIGGGASIKQGIEVGLKDKLEGKFVIAVNYACLHFPHTFLTCCDSDFYFPISLDTHPNIYEHLKTEPLIVTSANLAKNLILPNTLKVRGSGHKTVDGTTPFPYEHWGKQSKEKGFYTPINTGIFSLTLGLYLMDFVGTVYLLGFDWTCKDKPDDVLETHYYEDTIKHRGMDKNTGCHLFHGRRHPKIFYTAFTKDKYVKIYNVSPSSRIENFPRITYQNMFRQLSSEKYNQEELRSEIIKILKS